MKSKMANDALFFLPEGEDIVEEEDTWKVLIIDDDESVHKITKLILRDLSYQNRGIFCLSAYSAEEGKQILEEYPDTALILLDVVMETETSGLELVDYVRREKGLTDVRIILRTGQPGIAPEREVIDDYDIDGYKSKVELTDDSLYSAVRSGLKNFNDIKCAKDVQRKLTVAEATGELRKILTTMIIHDLRNPLSVIKLMIDLWKSNPVFKADGEIKKQFELTSHASETLFEMINKELQFSQLESGKYDVRPEPVDLNNLIDLIYYSVSHEFNDTLQYKYEASPKSFPTLCLDRGLIRRVLVNLLNNSLRHTKEGVISIRCIYHSMKEMLTLVITDTGTGIDKAEIPKLFSPFYQAENSKKKGDTFGIGLSFCDFATKAMGGEISIKSELGKGTEITLSIPAKPTRQPGLDLLSCRERDVLRCLSKNMTSKEIGEKLHISHRTVELHRANVMHKFNMQGKNQLLAFAVTNAKYLTDIAN